LEYQVSTREHPQANKAVQTVHHNLDKMDKMDNPSNTTNRGSQCSSGFSDASSSSHDPTPSLFGVGSHFEESLSEIRMRVLTLLPDAWSAQNRRGMSALNESFAPELGKMANDLFVDHMKLTPEAGAAFALPLFAFDGVCHGWRVKQPSWHLSNRNGGSLNIRHAITV
jgi:hypothetical protein